ncbi:hypothetical protein AB0K43_30035 [Kitasatospora sp. NPDC049258]|uniref:hypothetical protein n=1 Tax=Kitasatospora sp. NPDC049258 TaxID=3155394 RepID=UPI003425A883
MSAEVAGWDGGSRGDLVGRCYTKARRSPLVVGVVRGGDGRNLRLVGGPYTITQLAAMVATVVLLVVTRPVWGGHGWVDAAVVVGAPFGAAFALRHLHIDGRNPAAAATSIAMMLVAPRSGRLHGRPLRPGRPMAGGALVTVGPPYPDVAVGEMPHGRSAPAVPAADAPPAAVRHAAPAGAPVSSGVQALLARRAHLGD